MKKKKNNVTKYIIAIIVLLILVFSYYFYNKSHDNYNNIKINKSEYLVYTESEKQYGNYNQYKPHLNIKGELGTTINNNIDEYISNFEKNNICITYEYDLNGKILSLVIKVEDYSFVENAAILYFRSYNINLDTQELLSKDKVLNLFNTNSSDVEIKLNNKIEEYYNELVNKNIINTKECNYSCFKKSRNFEENMEDAEYFVRDGKLVVFKPYVYMINENSKIKYDFEIGD